MRMRALGFGEMLDEIFRFYRRNFGLLVLLSLAPVLPTLLLEIGSGQASQFGILGSLIATLGNPAATPGIPTHRWPTPHGDRGGPLGYDSTPRAVISPRGHVLPRAQAP